MKKEIKKGESWRIGYQKGYDETMKACGDCKNCYGKGYATVLEHASGSGDFFEEEICVEMPRMRFCTCERGKALKSEIKLIIKK